MLQSSKHTKYNDILSTTTSPVLCNKQPAAVGARLDKISLGTLSSAVELLGLPN